MITMTDSNRFGVASYTMTSINDLNNLPKRGLITSSTAILYGNDGSLRIWNFIASEKQFVNGMLVEVDGQWIEMV